MHSILTEYQGRLLQFIGGRRGGKGTRIGGGAGEMVARR
jgi:hypothetical protein